MNTCTHKCVFVFVFLCLQMCENHVFYLIFTEKYGILEGYIYVLRYTLESVIIKCKSYSKY